jgi:hypothetical protein
MLNILKTKTELTAGFKINNRGDCELLSDLILEKTSSTLSYNVLRRVFGLSGFKKPNKTTLNILAKYNGYKDYQDFLVQNPFESYWTIKEKLYDIINSDSNEILEFVASINKKNKDSIDILITLCRELIHIDRFDVLNDVFRCDVFNFTNFTYEEILHFGNSVGILFRNIEKINKDLLLNSNFLNFVYSIFVDYSNLSGYYSHWSEFVSKKSKDVQMRCFALSILQLKNYLELKPISFFYIDKIDYFNFHPILLGRIVSINILCENNFEDIEILKSNKFNLTKEFIWDFYYELIFSAILAKNFRLMKVIIDNLKKHKNPEKFHLQKHEKLFELMVLIYEYWNTGRIIKNERLKNIKKVRFEYSYKDMISIFINIVDYHTKKNNVEYLNYHIQITKKLNYPLFSKEYLITYFDS